MPTPDGVYTLSQATRGLSHVSSGEEMDTYIPAPVMEPSWCGMPRWVLAICCPVDDAEL